MIYTLIELDVVEKVFSFDASESANLVHANVQKGLYRIKDNYLRFWYRYVFPNLSAKLTDVVGVVKAYSTCVGEGPFVCEMLGEEAKALRKAGFEYGAKTGRARRVGPFDLVATRYGVEVQTATEIALTKLDVLSYMDRIPVCTHYMVNGEQTDRFPFPLALNNAKPVIEYFDGWKCDISDVRTWEDLPKEAREYVTFIEKEIGCPITYVSVGPERDSIVRR